MSYETAQINRQIILDCLNAQPTGYAPTGAEIVAATGLSKTSWQVSVKTLTAQREMEKIGNGKSVRYRARVKTTISAKELRSQIDAVRSAVAISNVKPAGSINGSYVHIAGHYPDVEGHVQGQPLRNQGGQGAVRHRVCVGSSAGMV